MCPPSRPAPSSDEFGPGPEEPPLPRWTPAAPGACPFTLFAATTPAELPLALLENYQRQVDRLNAENMELRRLFAAEQASRKMGHEWAQALLAEERAARRTEFAWLSSAKLYCTRSIGGQRFHTNRLCGGLQDDAPRELSLCLPCAKARAKARAHSR